MPQPQPLFYAQLTVPETLAVIVFLFALLVGFVLPIIHELGKQSHHAVPPQGDHHEQAPQARP